VKKQAIALQKILLVLLVSLCLTGCQNTQTDLLSVSDNNLAADSISVEDNISAENKEEQTAQNTGSADTSSSSQDESSINSDMLTPDDEYFSGVFSEDGTKRIFMGMTYDVIAVDGGDISGDRQPCVAVDIGFGDREYWAYTNEYGQLVFVTAKVVTLQDHDNEPVLETGRYYADEAKVPGTEAADLDEGHVIADSLGGVSNAYNITPQDSTLNRYGDQAYMEDTIREAGGCTDFFAVIEYPDTDTQIPALYQYTYVINGEIIQDEFANVNPDDISIEQPSASPEPTISPEPTTSPEPTASPELSSSPEPTAVTLSEQDALSDEDDFNEAEELQRIDTNGNGTVTIAEAEAAGFKMPITSDFWLYKYMTDRDHDGMVGE